MTIRSPRAPDTLLDFVPYALDAGATGSSSTTRLSLGGPRLLPVLPRTGFFELVKGDVTDPRGGGKAPRRDGDAVVHTLPPSSLPCCAEGAAGLPGPHQRRGAPYLLNLRNPDQRFRLRLDRLDLRSIPYYSATRLAARPRIPSYVRARPRPPAEQMGASLRQQPATSYGEPLRPSRTGCGFDGLVRWIVRNQVEPHPVC